VAAAYASGTPAADIAKVGSSMRFRHVAKWSICRMGFMGSERMKRFLEGVLKVHRFEDMPTPLGVLATDLCTGEPVSFRDTGDVFLPIRASCSYPGLFQPVPDGDRLLVDGAMSIEVPALLARQLGATHVISVSVPPPTCVRPPSDVLQIVRRCFQIMQRHSEGVWRDASDLILTPDLKSIDWNGFEAGPELVKAGEAARDRSAAGHPRVAVAACRRARRAARRALRVTLDPHGLRPAGATASRRNLRAAGDPRRAGLAARDRRNSR
jgi:NTE family protein